MVSGVWPRSVSGVLGALLSGMSDRSTYDEYGNSTRLNPAAAVVGPLDQGDEPGLQLGPGAPLPPPSVPVPPLSSAHREHTWCPLANLYQGMRRHSHHPQMSALVGTVGLRISIQLKSLPSAIENRFLKFQ